MKKNKSLGILVALILVTTVMIQCKGISGINQKQSIQTKDKKSEKVEVVKAKEPKETTKTPDGKTATNTGGSSNARLDDRGEIAAVAIVYPRLPSADNNPCEGKPTLIKVEKFEDGTILCNMSDQQLKQLTGEAFGSEKFCTCLQTHCGSSLEANKFLTCLLE